MNAETFLPLFIDALYRVDQRYYRHELWRDYEWREILERLANQPETKNLKDYLDRYGERVFCYELYHKTRLQMPDQDEDGIVFQAELRKEQLHDLKSHFPEIIADLEKAYIPDFLLHTPGCFHHQEVIIEVKTNPYLQLPDLKYDLKKISEFIVKYHYRIGLFLTVNTSIEHVIGECQDHCVTGKKIKATGAAQSE